MAWNQGIERLAMLLHLPTCVAEDLLEDAADVLEEDKEPWGTEDAIEFVLICRECEEFRQEYAEVFNG
jgi:hypothetical protein